MGTRDSDWHAPQVCVGSRFLKISFDGFPSVHDRWYSRDSIAVAGGHTASVSAPRLCGHDAHGKRIPDVVEGLVGGGVARGCA